MLLPTSCWFGSARSAFSALRSGWTIIPFAFAAGSSRHSTSVGRALFKGHCRKKHLKNIEIQLKCIPVRIGCQQPNAECSTCHQGYVEVTQQGLVPAFKMVEVDIADDQGKGDGAEKPERRQGKRQDALAAAQEEMAAPDDAPLDKKCDWCGKTFKKKSGLPTHQKSCDRKPEDWQEPKPKRPRTRHRPKRKQLLEVENIQEQLNKANEEKPKSCACRIRVSKRS
eukprot:Skav229977  [mRNA]  locus=scaffold372:264002:265517:+ [translate_table: standard]